MGFIRRLVSRAVHGAVRKGSSAEEGSAHMADAFEAVDDLLTALGGTPDPVVQALADDLASAREAEDLHACYSKAKRLLALGTLSEDGGRRAAAHVLNTIDAIENGEVRGARRLTRRALADADKPAAVAEARTALESARDSVQTAIGDVRNAIRILRQVPESGVLAGNMDAYLRPWLERMIDGDSGGGIYLENAIMQLEEMEAEFKGMDFGPQVGG